MAQHLEAAPTCSICGDRMHERLRGPAQLHLPREFLCCAFDCPDFGIYKTVVSIDLGSGPAAAVPGAFLG